MVTSSRIVLASCCLLISFAGGRAQSEESIDIYSAPGFGLTPSGSNSGNDFVSGSNFGSASSQVPVISSSGVSQSFKAGASFSSGSSQSASFGGRGQGSFSSNSNQGSAGIRQSQQPGGSFSSGSSQSASFGGRGQGSFSSNSNQGSAGIRQSQQAGGSFSSGSSQGASFGGRGQGSFSSNSNQGSSGFRQSQQAGGSFSSGSSQSASLGGRGQGSLSSNSNRGSSGSASAGVNGGIDFSQAQRTADGRLCVIRESEIETLSKDPILECTHKDVEKCHYTYVTQFTAAQEEVCEENFEKLCQITFNKKAVPQTVRKCITPQRKICNGQGPRKCKTYYESSCTTRYVEKQPGKFVGDTKCEKLPVEICGNGCVVDQGAEECHEKETSALVDVPEEICDLNPQKTCRLATKLSPQLKPKHECTVIPQEICQLKFSAATRKTKPLKSEWCLDESPVQRGQTYEDFAGPQ